MTSCQLFPKSDPSWQVNKQRYRQADASETRVVVSIHDQKAWLLDKQGRVVLKTDVSTGVPGHETPPGEHKVLEMLKDKRSNKYGKYVKEGSGKVVVPKTWLHEGPPPEGTVYEGIEMPYWMRLTWHGVGMHVGKFPKRTRCSFGCIRVYHKAQPLIYKKVTVGTSVTVHDESLTLEMAGKEKFGLFR
ncbi:MAG: L,D-transpeptidase [Akkermansiaceae bacterium]|nr:L,D-transpeptidase [Akkermansiaceae bacterium]